MKYWSTRAGVLALSATAIVGAATTATAQTWDKRTHYTFSAPFEMPGITLEPGEYVFRLADPNGSRQIMQVTSKDEKEVYGLFFSIPIEANEAATKPEVRFYEADAGAKPAIKAVWYPGDRTGREFIYPREQASRLAKSTREPILTTASDTSKAEETRAAALARIDDDGRSVAIDAPARAETSTASAASGTQSAPMPSASQSDSRIEPTSGSLTAANRPASSIGGGTATVRNSETAAARSELPSTASPVPALMLAGIALVALALSLRAIRTA